MLMNDYLGPLILTISARKYLGGLRQIKYLICKETAIMIYNSLIQPWFDYCDVVWDNPLPATSAERLQELQNLAASVITRECYEVRSNNILQRLGWNSLTQRRFQHKATIMFKILDNNGPRCLK